MSSPVLQRMFSAAYAAARIRPVSALIVPVPEAEEALGTWRERETRDGTGLPLHVTLMYPFLRASAINDLDELAIAKIAQSIEPFAFELARFGHFPGVHYLAPEPSAPFVEIVEAIKRRWPSCAPYGGAYDSVVPHVTVAFSAELPPGLRELGQLLPIRARASEIWLIELSRRGCKIRHRFPLGEPSAA